MCRKALCICILTTLIISPLLVRAQFSLDFEAGVGLPFSNLGNQVNAGFGGQLNLNYFIRDHFSVGAGIGYYTFTSSENAVTFEEFRVNITPLVIQADYYFTESDVKPFIGLQVGLYRLANRFLANNITQVVSSDNIGIAPKVGVIANVVQNFNFVGNIKYHYLSSEFDNNAFLSIHLGFSYKFSK